MSDIQLFSKKIRLLFQFLFFATPILTVLYWLNIEKVNLVEINFFSIPLTKVTFNDLSKALGFTISLLPMTIIMFSFYRLMILFKNYEKGIVFSQENVISYKKLGISLFVLALVDFLCSGLMSLALSFQNPPGERYIMVSFGTPEVSLFIIGLVILGVSYVMQEAFRLEEESRHTI